MNTKPITDTDVHAWVDGELPAARRAEVDDHFARNPGDAARARDYLAQRQAVAELQRSALDEPLPERLARLAQPPAANAGRMPPYLQRLAAGIAVATLGALAGWFAHDRIGAPVSLARAPMPALVHQAAVAHAVFSPEVRRPVEVGADHEDQLVTWLSKRLGKPVRPPHLGRQGFDLIGGRLLAGERGPVAQFMYQDAGGQRLTLFVSTENAAGGDTAFRFARERDLNVFYWVDGSFGYALSASIDKGRLAEVATAVYDQLETRPRP